MSEKLVEAIDLCKYFEVRGGKTLKAVDHVSFVINKGETLGLVGESGCGKTTCGRTVIKLYHPTSGKILFEGKDVSDLSKEETKRFRKDVQIIFQDPYSSLDPRMTISELISEGMDEHFNYTKEEKTEKINDLLYSVGLSKDYANRFAHELSGGQRQRIGIARALAVEPKFIVCDEPIAALDVSIQAQIVNLLIKLQRDRGFTYLFISHDLSMVKHISDRIGVMYLGSMVELASSADIFRHQYHPYTQALLSAIPEADPVAKNVHEHIHLEGEVPSPVHIPSGCKFHTRCPYATDICSEQVPEFREVEPGRFAACHHCLEKKED